VVEPLSETPALLHWLQWHPLRFAVARPRSPVPSSPSFEAPQSCPFDRRECDDVHFYSLPHRRQGPASQGRHRGPDP
jgi:hypothetical protein